MIMQKDKKPIIVMLCYPRSGGTLLNRVLSSLENTIVLSEVSPTSICQNKTPTIFDQARDWYNIPIIQGTFESELEQIYNWTTKNDYQLIIRDWSFGSFVKTKYNNNTASFKLDTLSYISNTYPCSRFGFVRNAIDVWLSMYNSPHTFRDRDFAGMLKFALALHKESIPLFKYEEFCQNPIKTLSSIGKSTGIRISDTVHPMSLLKFHTVNGDTDPLRGSRALSKDKPVKLPRRKHNQHVKREILETTHIQKINELFEYE